MVYSINLNEVEENAIQANIDGRPVGNGVAQTIQEWLDTFGRGPVNTVVAVYNRSAKTDLYNKLQAASPQVQATVKAALGLDKAEVVK